MSFHKRLEIPGVRVIFAKVFCAGDETIQILAHIEKIKTNKKNKVRPLFKACIVIHYVIRYIVMYYTVLP